MPQKPVSSRHHGEASVGHAPTVQPVISSSQRVVINHSDRSNSGPGFRRSFEFIKGFAQGNSGSGLCLIEGIRALFMAVDHGEQIERIVVCPELLQNLPMQRLVKKLRIAGTPCTRLSRREFLEISRAPEPQGVAAIVKQPQTTLADIDLQQSRCWLVLESIQSPGNLGTIIRTCDAAGVSGIILVGDAADPFSPATSRACMGSLFAIKHVRASLAAFADWKRTLGAYLVGATGDGAADYRAAEFPSGCLIAMGCERKGLSADLRKLCDALVRIPMVGTADSLNVGVAAGLMVYEAYRRQHGVG